MPLSLSTSSTSSYPHNYHHPLLLKPPFLLPHNHPFLLPPPLLLQPLRASTSPTNPSLSSRESLPHSAIQRIAEKLRSLGFHEHPQTPTPGPHSPGEIFLPSPSQLPSHRVGHTLDLSWSSPLDPVPRPGTGNAITKHHELRNVASKERKEEKGRKRKEKEKEKEKEKAPSLAELMLSKAEIRRLTTIGIRMKQKIKIGKAGVTEGVVNGIHERWRSFEVVRVVCEDICWLNMKNTHHLLERKTGGVVVWRSGSKIVLYRGANYKYPYFSLDEASSSSSSQNAMDSVDQRIQEGSLSPETHIVETAGENSRGTLDQSSLIKGVGSPSRVRFLLPGEKQLIEEADKLLEGLGPRFTDWWGYDPLPVDADLLPAVIPDYRKPFRLLPYGVKPKLTDDELTILKRVGRPLPCHFALGRNRKHQGLATAILKLWEKCEIAKIAVKRGVQNTNSRFMAEELKRLTGGILLSRDKDYIVLYRGKDFLPSAVSSAIAERQKRTVSRDKKLIDVSSTLPAEYPTPEYPTPSGEGHVSVSKSEEASRIEKVDCTQEKKTKSIEAAITGTSRKLFKALEEKAKAEKLLSDLEQAEISPQAVDKEGITEEERYMLRRVGLKMNPFLLLGRRGVFDGTIENMHLHWKYRELVKIICGGRSIDEIHNVARLLEAESGGILVAVERVTKGFAVIVYRGKNYQRPANLRPQTLLNKKEALKRSIEAQRRESLKLNVLKLTGRIEKLKRKLVASKMNTTDEQLKFQPKGLEEHDLKPTISSDSTDPQEGSMSSTQQEKLVNAPTLYQETHETTEQCPSGSADEEMNPNSVLKEKTSRVPYNGDVDHVVAAFSKTNHVAPDDSGSASRDKLLVHSTSRVTKPLTGPVSEGSEHHPFETWGRNIPEKELAPPVHKTSERDSSVVSTRARPLTNKERLLLRRQALKIIKTRRVLAVGKSNAITGIAKAIREHFKKHALAIVDVKGRAKGTSVQDVVFQLEQATGGVLVSQEPSKIILYRGWGGGVDILHRESDHHDKQAAAPSMAVSPELVKAMRLECGLSID